MRLAGFIVVAVLALAPRAHAQGVEYIEDGKALLVVGACGEGTTTAIQPAAYAAHCKKVRAVIENYRKRWLAPARALFARIVPAGLPKKVVYPFAGGDLATALAIYPDADEITTISLEPAGDPRALLRLSAPELEGALATVAAELTSFYRASYSVTMNMIGAMRAGKLPTQLIFGLSALAIHGYEPVSLRYVAVNDDGSLKYLEKEDVAAADGKKSTRARNAVFSSIELRFKKLGSTRIQTYRHLLANLNDAQLKKHPGTLAHLADKGAVAGMTKAASYLLTMGEFSTLRQYIIDRVVWMVSDTTGLAPKYGIPAGFEYETYGSFTTANMAAGKAVSPAYNKLFASQPKRPLGFRFGYPDGTFRNGHLVVMRKATAK